MNTWNIEKNYVFSMYENKNYRPKKEENNGRIINKNKKTAGTIKNVGNKQYKERIDENVNKTSLCFQDTLQK